MRGSNEYPESDERQLSPGNTVYHVNPASGDDSNTGLSSATAWKIKLRKLRASPYSIS